MRNEAQEPNTEQGAWAPGPEHENIGFFKLVCREHDMRCSHNFGVQADI